MLKVIIVISNTFLCIVKALARMHLRAGSNGPSHTHLCLMISCIGSGMLKKHTVYLIDILIYFGQYTITTMECDLY